MKILDIYVLKHFIKNLLFGLLCFILIFVLVDLFENVDKFLDKELSAFAIFLYYLYFIPEILKLITPVAMLLATLFLMSKFNNYSELVAIKASGISLLRFSMSILIFGAFITAASIYFNGWIVPESNSLKFNFERTYLDKNKISGIVQNLHIQDDKNKIIYFSNYNEREKLATNASVQIFDESDNSRLITRFDASAMKWDSVRKDWKMISVTKRSFDSSSTESYFFQDTVYASQVPEIGALYISPNQIIKNQLKPDEIKLNDLDEFISGMEKRGQNVFKAEVDYYSKISFPFANIIIIFFGISIGMNRRKGGAALQFGISIFISFLYLGFIKISQTFGYNGEINPLLAAWSANIIFLLISIANLIKTNILWK